MSMMTLFFLLFIAICITLFLHMLLHRVCKHMHVPVILSLGIYPVAVIIYFFFSLSLCSTTTPFLPNSSFCIPFSSTLIYTLMSCIIIVSYIFQVAMKSKTPAATILAYLKKHKHATIKELETLFTEEEMIDKRLRDLTYAGTVSKKGRYYSLTPKGSTVIKYIHIIQTLLQMDIGG